MSIILSSMAFISLFFSFDIPCHHEKKEGSWRLKDFSLVAVFAVSEEDEEIGDEL